jgi:hypothetical protein
LTQNDDDLSPNHTIDGMARMRISDHIRDCARRYEDMRGEIRGIRADIAETGRTRFTLLMAVLVAAVSGVFQIILHFVPPLW